MQWCRGERSPIEQVEHRFRITGPGKSIFRRDFLDASQIVIAKIDIERSGVLFLESEQHLRLVPVPTRARAVPAYIFSGEQSRQLAPRDRDCAENCLPEIAVS